MKNFFAEDRYLKIKHFPQALVTHVIKKEKPTRLCANNNCTNPAYQHKKYCISCYDYKIDHSGMLPTLYVSSSD